MGLCVVAFVKVLFVPVVLLLFSIAALFLNRSFIAGSCNVYDFLTVRFDSLRMECTCTFVLCRGPLVILRWNAIRREKHFILVFICVILDPLKPCCVTGS